MPKEYKHIYVDAIHVNASGGILSQSLREACVMCLEENREVVLSFAKDKYHLGPASLISFAETMKVRK